MPREDPWKRRGPTAWTPRYSGRITFTKRPFHRSGGDAMGHGVSRSLTLLILAVLASAMVTACKSAPPAEAPVTAPPAFESSKAPKAEKVEETTGFKPADTQSEAV